MSYFRWDGGAVRLIEPVEDRIDRAQAWGHLEKDRYTVPFGPSSLDPESRHGGPWVWRYGSASNGTGAKYSALATRVHADVAGREGGPIIVTLTSPWTAAHAFAAEGYLHDSYVAEKLYHWRLNLHEDDLATVTELVRILLGRTET